MSQDAHQLQVTNRELEATIGDLKRTIMQLEDRIDREEAESRRLTHLVGDKNEEIESLKALVHQQKRQNIELQEELQRHMSSPAMSSPPSASAGAMIERGMQTYVDITPPEEVDRMHQQIEELQMQIEQYQAEMNDFGATCIRNTGGLEGSDSDRDGSPDPALQDDNDSFCNTISPSRKPPRLQLNLAIPPNLGAADNSDVVLTARGAGAPNETPRAHIRIPQALVTSRGLTTARGDSIPLSNVPLTARRNVSEPAVQQTPRISTAELMKRSYVDPTSTAAGAAAGGGIIGDYNYSDSQSPNGNRQVSMSVIENGSPTTRRKSSVAPPPAAASSAPARTVVDNGDPTAADSFASQQFRRHAGSVFSSSPQGTSASPGDADLNINGSSSPRTSNVTTTDVDIAASGGHMFSIEDADEGCPVCSLMEQIQSMYTGKECLSKEAYYAVGWIPDLCHRWSLEHNIAWTIEERAAVATALTNRTKLSAFTTYTHRGPVSIWRKRPFWRSAWRTAYAVLQGVFLYIFNSSNPNEPVVAVIPVRASFIELVTLNGRTRCLQISSLGCQSCVGATAGDCVETMTIALDSQRDLVGWEKSLKLMQRTCAHKCSQKFMNEINAIREIAELLLTSAKENDKRRAEKEKRAAIAA